MTIVFISLFVGFVIATVYLFLKNQNLVRDNFKLSVLLEQERKSVEAKVSEVSKVKEEFSREFENISNRILKMQREDFDKEQRASLSVLLNPFQTQIRDFRDLIEKTNLKNENDKGALSKELLELKNLNATLSKNADDLTNALKGNAKVQGDWGEHMLKDILDMAGFLEGTDYQMQFNVKGENGENLRPDCVINLPNGKKLIVDSKVSISAYIDFIREENPDRKKEFLKNHIASVKKHIAELSSKEYQKYLSDFEFVFMFIPNEQAYIEALKCDNCIYDNAYKANVAITTPSSILPILRTVKNLWNIEKQNQNASVIAEKAGRLYDKLVGFVENMKKIDKGLISAKNAYDEAFNQLSDGRGSAISIAEDMKAKGARTIKSIGIDSKKLISSDEE
ncbi:DNA recombination protein RmuC [bacterium]|nr:DNA recombination protein RmuC [bacterium]